MKITAIKRQSKRGKRVSVFVDGKYSFSFSDSQLVEHKLRENDELNTSVLKKLKKISKIGNLQETALNWALRRHHSSREIDDYLKKKTNHDKIHKQIVNYLSNLGFVDDRKFAEEWLKQRRTKGYSKFIIKGELLKKGVSDEILEDIFTLDEEEIEALKSLVNKKKHLSRYQNKQKFIAYLASKGFQYSDIKTVLKND